VDLGGPQLTAGPFLLDPECLGLLAESTAANIPPRSLMDEMGWIDFDDDRGKKFASKVETQLGIATRAPPKLRWNWVAFRCLGRVSMADVSIAGNRPAVYLLEGDKW
jgi:hypothetical protein